MEHLPAPWPNFKDDLEILAGRCMVSHKPDHGAEGALHNDTAYGMVSGPDHRGAYTVRHRVMLSSLKGPKDLDKVAPPRLRAQIKDALSGYNETDFRRTIARFSEETGIRRVRVEEVLSVFPVRNKEGYSYKWLKGDSNYCAEIVRESNGAWKIELIPTFRANQPDFQEFLRDRAHCFQRSFSGKPLIMRLCKDDTLAIGTEQSRRILLVTELNEKRLVLIRPNEGGNLKMRHADTDDPFRKEFMGPSTLKKLKARRVFVDIVGRVKDPGVYGDDGADRGDRPGGVPPARGARVPGGAGGA